MKKIIREKINKYKRWPVDKMKNLFRPGKTKVTFQYIHFPWEPISIKKKSKEISEYTYYLHTHKKYMRLLREYLQLLEIFI